MSPASKRDAGAAVIQVIVIAETAAAGASGVDGHIAASEFRNGAGPFNDTANALESRFKFTSTIPFVPKKSAVAPTRRTNTDAESKSVRTRARILDAAAHILSAKGFAGTRLSDVAEHAEIQAPAIYYYFGSREELIEEVMYCGVAELRKHVQEALDDLPPETAPMDRIIVAVEAHLRHELEISDYATASIRNSGQIPQHLRTRQLKEETAYGRLWRRLFENALAEGQMRADLDPRYAQLLVLGALNWAAEWREPRRDAVDSIVVNAQSLVRYGLCSFDQSDDARGTRKACTTARRR